MKDNKPIQYTTACWIDERLVSFYTHTSRTEADNMLRFYQSRPGWHLYTRIKQSDAFNQELRTWKR